jgi:hypothetical protein
MKEEAEFCTQVPTERQSHLDVTISKENEKKNGSFSEGIQFKRNLFLP